MELAPCVAVHDLHVAKGYAIPGDMFYAAQILCAVKYLKKIANAAEQHKHEVQGPLLTQYLQGLVRL